VTASAADVLRVARHYFDKGRCSGHDKFNGKYCRDAAGPERWCIHCAGFMLLTAFEAALSSSARSSQETHDPGSIRERLLEQARFYEGNTRGPLAGLVALLREAAGALSPRSAGNIWPVATGSGGVDSCGCSYINGTKLPCEKHWSQAETQRAEHAAVLATDDGEAAALSTQPTEPLAEGSNEHIANILGRALIKIRFEEKFSADETSKLRAGLNTAIERLLEKPEEGDAAALDASLCPECGRPEKQCAVQPCHGPGLHAVREDVIPEWLRRWMAGEQMGASTGIAAEESTYGYGALDNNGYFEIPVPPAFAAGLDRHYQARKLREGSVPLPVSPQSAHAFIAERGEPARVKYGEDDIAHCAVCGQAEHRPIHAGEMVPLPGAGASQELEYLAERVVRELWVASVGMVHSRPLAARTAILRALREARALSSPTDGWQAIEAGMPANGRTVLVSFLNSLGNRRTARAAYFDADTLDMDEDGLEDAVNENGANVDAGWFEDCESREPGYWPLQEQITHWMLLPLPPQPQPTRDEP
jgi:hypothetical protein